VQHDLSERNGMCPSSGRSHTGHRDQWSRRSRKGSERDAAGLVLERLAVRMAEAASIRLRIYEVTVKIMRRGIIL
jgi:hypothetical protein